MSSSSLVRLFHRVSSQHLVAYAIVLLVLIVLAGMVCLAARRELFAVDSAAATKGFAADPGKCNPYMGPGTYDARGSTQDKQCTHYSFDKPTVFQDSIQAADASAIKFCHSTVGGSTGSAGAPTPSEMLQCEHSIDSVMTDAQKKMQADIDAAKQQMSQSMQSELSKIEASVKSSVSSNKKALDALQQQYQNLRGQANTAVTQVQTARKDAQQCYQSLSELQSVLAKGGGAGSGGGGGGGSGMPYGIPTESKTSANQAMLSASDALVLSEIDEGANGYTPAPGGSLVPAPGGSLVPAPGPAPVPAPVPAPGGSPAPAPGGSPAPAPGGSPIPAPGGSPAPAPGGSPAPAPGGSPAPAPGGSPIPAPGGSPAPAPGGSPAPAPGGSPAPAPGGSPIPAPGPAPGPAPVPGAGAQEGFANSSALHPYPMTTPLYPQQSCLVYPYSHADDSCDQFTMRKKAGVANGMVTRSDADIRFSSSSHVPTFPAYITHTTDTCKAHADATSSTFAKEVADKHAAFHSTLTGYQTQFDMRHKGIVDMQSQTERALSSRVAS